MSEAEWRLSQPDAEGEYACTCLPYPLDQPCEGCRANARKNLPKRHVDFFRDLAKWHASTAELERDPIIGAFHLRAATELNAFVERPQQFPIPLSDAQEAAVKLWAADDRLWTIQETVEFNLRTFARTILASGGNTSRDIGPVERMTNDGSIGTGPDRNS
jgi:hypothetical protein